MATLTRWRWPTESVAERSSAIASTPARASTASASAAGSASPARRANRRTFSRGVSFG